MLVNIPGLTVNRLGCLRRMGDGVRRPRLDVLPTLCDGGLGLDNFGRMLERASCLIVFCRRMLR